MTTDYPFVLFCNDNFFYYLLNDHFFKYIYENENNFTKNLHIKSLT